MNASGMVEGGNINGFGVEGGGGFGAEEDWGGGAVKVFFLSDQNR